VTSLVTLLSSKGQAGYAWPARCTGRRYEFTTYHSRWLHSEACPGWSAANFVDDDATDGSRQRARDAFSKLAKKGRSWRRLRHMVDLACLGDKEKVQSIADIGCDHGLLTLGLAVSGRFESVIGVDLSEQALSDGAISLYRQMLQDLKKDERWNSSSSEQLKYLFPVDFCVGDGLRVLKPGQADALCIAGMGVNTMIRILEPSEVDRVGCKYLVLQPTNSRPRNLIRLYDSLADAGWTAMDERIEFLSSRWYISALFARAADDGPTTLSSNMCFPGQLLSLSDESYSSYVQHHQKWIERDSRSGSMQENDRRWLEFVKDANTQ